MTVQPMAPVTCQTCNAQFSTPVQNLINGQETGLKTAFLQGRINVYQCPQCGSIIRPNVPVLYYDLEKELALVFAPNSLNLGGTAQEKAVGQLTNRLVESLPAEQRKMYLFNPKQFLTHDSIAKAILLADGITEEMMETQAARAKLLEELMQTPDEAALKEKIKTHDHKLDYDFFEMFTALIHDIQLQGDQTQAQGLFAMRTFIARRSSQGKKFVAEIDKKIGLIVVENQEELLKRIENTQDEQEFEALIAAGHTLLDYTFFQKLTGKIDQATKNGAAQTAAKLKALRSKILDVKAKHEEENRKAIEKASELLKKVLQSDRPDKVLEKNLKQIDDAFFLVLRTHIDEARRQKQEKTAKAMEMIGNIAITMLQAKKAENTPVVDSETGPQPQAESPILISKR